MIITGKINKEIYPQELINWSTVIVAPYTSGDFTLSFSGESGICEVANLKNGKILSPNLDLLGSYNANERVLLSGNINGDTMDLYKNSLPLYLGVPRQNSSMITAVEFNSKNNSAIELQNITIKGNPANVYFGYDPNLSGSALPLIMPKYGTGIYSIYNDGQYTFKIASGYSENTNFFTSGLSGLNISPYSSGDFYIINQRFIDLAPQNVPIKIFTNGGDMQFNVDVIGQDTAGGSSYMYWTSSDSTRIVNNNINLYTVLFYNSDGVDISASLTHISGLTGSYYRSIFTNNILNEYVISGNFSGTGILVQPITGIISGYNNMLSGYEYGTGSGFASGFVSGFISGQPALVTCIATGTGYLQGNINTYTGERKFTGIWDMRTGLYNIYSFFRENNQVSGESYYSRLTSSEIGKDISVLQVQIGYSNIYNTLSQEPTDQSKLTISGINFGQNGTGIFLDLVGLK